MNEATRLPSNAALSRRGVRSAGALLVFSALAFAGAVAFAGGNSEEKPLSQRIAVTGLGLEDARQFFAKLQAAVRAGDRAAVSAMVELPLDADVAGARQTIGSRRAFEEHYDSIISSRVRDVILAQDFDSLFANWRGLMIGRGEVWFGGICADATCKARRIRIIAVNTSEAR